MRYLVVAVALGLATPALAAEQAVQEQQQRNEPVLMTEVELDAVVAGSHAGNHQEGLVNVSISNIKVAANVVAAVAANANVLGQQNAVADATTRPVSIQQ